jgi:hypothetical protein
MRTSKLPFLHSYAVDLNIGDLVTWKEWKKQDDTTFVSADQRGALIGFIEKPSLTKDRMVLFAVILPYGETKTREISVHLIKKDTN